MSPTDDELRAERDHTARTIRDSILDWLDVGDRSLAAVADLVDTIMDGIVWPTEET